MDQTADKICCTLIRCVLDFTISSLLTCDNIKILNCPIRHATWHGRMLLKHLDLTTALRPSYLPDEVLLFTQDNVGLYEGKYKLADYQNGQVYLTSHRICYVDYQDPRKYCTAIDLKDVEAHEFYAGFFKSSPKITLIAKPQKRSLLKNRASSSLNGSIGVANTSPPRTDSISYLPTSEPTPTSTATWVCPICSFSNPVPFNFDPTTANERTLLAPCLACGIKPPWALVLKAAISNATNRPAVAPIQIHSPTPLHGPSPKQDTSADLPRSAISGQVVGPNSDRGASFQCSRCTFLNHPSLISCEMCGAPLISQDLPSDLNKPVVRTESPGPVVYPMHSTALDESERVKLSFRGGGEKIFYERLKASITQRKWLLQFAPPVPIPNRSTGSRGFGSGTANGERVQTVGIAGLEARRMQERKNNERVIGSAFEDLEALIASAKDIIALAESFAATNGNPTLESNSVANALGLVTTKDMLGGGSSSQSLYINELSRNLAELLTDDARGVLRKAGGIISLVDLWAIFNRARGGVELVSPIDFEKAAMQWEVLKLPVRLRKFKSGVLVVQGSDRTDAKTIEAISSWLNELHVLPPERKVAWDWRTFGRGVTAQDAAERFGWSIGVAEEELEMAEEASTLCREEGIEGTRFWKNYIDLFSAGEDNLPIESAPSMTEYDGRVR